MSESSILKNNCCGIQAFNLIFEFITCPILQVNYSSPVVAVRFAGVQYDTHIQVQCKLNGYGIINDSPTDRYLGSVTFSLDVGA